MSYRDIGREKIYMPFSVSTRHHQRDTDKVIPELKQWQQRPLEKVYPRLADAIHYKSPGGWSLPEQGRSHGAGANLEGKKKFWVCIRQKVKALTGYPYSE